MAVLYSINGVFVACVCARSAVNHHSSESQTWTDDVVYLSGDSVLVVSHRLRLNPVSNNKRGVRLNALSPHPSYIVPNCMSTIHQQLQPNVSSLRYGGIQKAV